MQLRSIVLAYNCESWVQSIKAKQTNKKIQNIPVCGMWVCVCTAVLACILHMKVRCWQVRCVSLFLPVWFFETASLRGQSSMSQLADQSSLGSASLQSIPSSNFKLLLESKLKSSQSLSKHFIHGVNLLSQYTVFPNRQLWVCQSLCRVVFPTSVNH